MSLVQKVRREKSPNQRLYGKFFKYICVMHLFLVLLEQLCSPPSKMIKQAFLFLNSEHTVSEEIVDKFSTLFVCIVCGVFREDQLNRLSHRPSKGFVGDSLDDRIRWKRTTPTRRIQKSRMNQRNLTASERKRYVAKDETDACKAISSFAFESVRLMIKRWMNGKLIGERTNSNEAKSVRIVKNTLFLLVAMAIGNGPTLLVIRQLDA